MDKILLRALTMGRVPNDVAWAAEVLGDGVVGTTIKVALPGEWVNRAQSKGSKVAAWAIANCDDTSVLNEIARGASAKRVGVARALLSNKVFTDKDLRLELEAVLLTKSAKGTTRAKETAKAPAPVLTTRELVEELKEMSKTSGPSDVLDSNELKLLLSRGDLATGDVDEVVLAMLSGMEKTSVAARFLGAVSGVDTTYSSVFKPSLLWAKTSYDVDSVLGLMKGSWGKSDISETISELLEAVTCETVKAPRANRVGTALTQAFLYYGDAGEIESCEHYSLMKDAFSVDSIDILLGSKKLLAKRLLSYQILRGDQVQRYMAGMSSKQKEIVLANAAASKSMALEVLESYTESDKICDAWTVRGYESIVKNTREPLARKLIARFSGSLIMEYLTGWLVLIKGTRVPDVAEVAGLAERLRKESASECLVWAGGLLNRRVDTWERYYGEEYFNKLIDVVPGIMGVVLQAEGADKAVERIWGKLEASGAEIAVIVDQLRGAPGESLERMCQVLAAMARADKAVSTRS